MKYLAARKLYTVVSSVVSTFAGVGHTPHTYTKNFSPAYVSRIDPATDSR